MHVIETGHQLKIPAGWCVLAGHSFGVGFACQYCGAPREAVA